MRRITWLLGVAVCAGLLSGCVERRYVVYTTPPAALVLQNGQPVNPSPADNHFIYYGDYEFTLIKEGYQTKKVVQHIPAPWYQRFPIDIVSEILLPWKIVDRREFHYELEPVQAVRSDDLINQAQNLRNRAHTVAPPTGSNTVNTVPGAN